MLPNYTLLSVRWPQKIYQPIFQTNELVLSGEPARIARKPSLKKFLAIGKLIMRSKYLSRFCALLIISNLTACKNYSVSLNDNMIYAPAALFKAFSISDKHLHTCVEQTIIDQKITKAEDLKQLNCSHAGIKSLAGLEKFSAIEQLNLSENALVNIAELSHLTQINVVILRNNNLKNAEPLLHLLHLRELDISENDNLACGEVKQLIANFNKADLSAILPAQCKTGI